MELENNVVFPDEVKFPADEVLDQFRIVLQAVDGAGQAAVLCAQAGILPVQLLALLMQTIDPVETLMGE